MKIRQQHVLDSVKSPSPTRGPQVQDKTAIEQNFLPTALDVPAKPYDGCSVLDHNRQLEEIEHSARLEEWIEDQNAHQQSEVHQQELQPANAKFEVVGGCALSSPALPPHPCKLLGPSSAPQSRRDALLSEIRELGSGRTRVVASVTQHPSDACKSNEDFKASNIDLEVASSIRDNAKSRGDPLTPPFNLDPSLLSNTAALQAKSRAGGPGLALDVDHPSGPSSSYTPCQLPMTDSCTRRSLPTLLPPELEPSRPESAILDKMSPSPTNPSHSILVPPKRFMNNASLRTFTSNCGNFRVEADLLDWKDGKVWLRKGNGVKIAVLLSRLSGQDVEYVVAEMMQRAEQRALSYGCMDSQALRQGEPGPFHGFVGGLQSELEEAYAVATCEKKTHA